MTREYICNSLEFADRLEVRDLIRQVAHHVALDVHKRNPEKVAARFINHLSSFKIYFEIVDDFFSCVVYKRKTITFHKMMFDRVKGQKETLRFLFLHEIAHVIDDFYYNSRFHHGESWVRIMFYFNLPSAEVPEDGMPKEIQTIYRDLFIGKYAKYEASCMDCGERVYTIKRPYRRRCAKCKDCSHQGKYSVKMIDNG